jgi:hypothetical protein
LTPEHGKLGIVVQGELARLLSASVPRDQVANFESCLQMVAGAQIDSQVVPFRAAIPKIVCSRSAA